MKIIAILCFFLPVFSLETKLCINCKYLIPNTRNIKFSKCFLFPKVEEDHFKFINGDIDDTIDYHYCSTARGTNSMCGKKGKEYEQ
jgi:hypothetical protein